MIFDWDPDKNASTHAARGFGFATAALIFMDRVVTWQDMRRDYGERRMIAVGQTGGRFYTIVYTDRGTDGSSRRGQQIERNAPDGTRLAR